MPPDQADWLAGALHTHRDWTVVLAMLLAGLRRCEMPVLWFAGVRVTDRLLLRRLDVCDECRAGGGGAVAGEAAESGGE